MLKKINVKTKEKEEFLKITDEVKEAVDETGVKEGILQIFVPHNSSAVTILGTKNGDIVKDVQFEINKLNDDFGHVESTKSASHFKSSLFGVDLNFIIDGGKLILGPKQGIYLTDFDGPAEREVLIKIIEG